MPESGERFLQVLAFTIMCMGLVACGVGDHFKLTTLANGGTTAIGVAAGLLTGKALQQLSTKGGGDIVNAPPKDV